MKTLLLGHSSIARRRVLPALDTLGIAYDIASQSDSTIGDSDKVASSARCFGSYAQALDQSDAPLVYISTHNVLHAQLARQALEHGKHTIIDKPATLSLHDSESLVELASARGLCLAEANVWAHHPQVQAARRVFAEADSEPSRILAAFSFPLPLSDNFRYHEPMVGGGALWDLGAYTVSPGRVFFGQAPRSIHCEILARSGTVDVAYSVLMTYAGGRSLVGQFGFTTGYINRMDLLGPNTTVQIDRIFTTPADMNVTLAVNQHNQRSQLAIAAGDTFANFLGAVIRSIEDSDWQIWPRTLLEDAHCIEQLRRAAGLPT